MKSLSFLILLVLFTSCINLSDPERQINYINAYNEFLSTDVSHIPQKQPKIILGYTYKNPNSGSMTGTAYLFVSEKKMLKKRYMKIKESYLNQAIFHGMSTDSIYTIVNQSDNIKKHYQKKENSTEIIPIPYEAILIEDFFTGTIQILANYEIIVLSMDNISGKSESYEKFNSPRNDWYDYVSKGLGFNDEEKIINYWTVYY